MSTKPNLSIEEKKNFILEEFKKNKFLLSEELIEINNIFNSLFDDKKKHTIHALIQEEHIEKVISSIYDNLTFS